MGGSEEILNPKHQIPSVNSGQAQTISNDKAQMSSQAQKPNNKTK
jgi:hypothetical protein